jgi:hypothetical protein
LQRPKLREEVPNLTWIRNAWSDLQPQDKSATGLTQYSEKDGSCVTIQPVGRSPNQPKTPESLQNSCLFLARTLPQAYAWPSAIPIDEFDARGLHGAFNYLEGCSTRSAQSCLDLTNGHDSDSGPVCELLLGPIEESASCPALRRSDHHLKSWQKWPIPSNLSKID